uniref:Uncharacterized protein n=1 Tax=Anguilla anguilla TaxID=7936 RepID=A0A0E9PVR0_ANGAN
MPTPARTCKDLQLCHPDFADGVPQTSLKPRFHCRNFTPELGTFLRNSVRFDRRN